MKRGKAHFERLAGVGAFGPQIVHSSTPSTEAVLRENHIASLKERLYSGSVTISNTEKGCIPSVNQSQPESRAEISASRLKLQRADLSNPFGSKALAGFPKRLPAAHYPRAAGVSRAGSRRTGSPFILSDR